LESELPKLAVSQSPREIRMRQINPSNICYGISCDMFELSSLHFLVFFFFVCSTLTLLLPSLLFMDGISLPLRNYKIGNGIPLMELWRIH
jgi:hypothetical protein